MQSNEAGLTEPAHPGAAHLAQPGGAQPARPGGAQPARPGGAQPARPGGAPGEPGAAAPGGAGRAAGIARGAALIAGLTALSRLLGLVRTLVFSQSVGAGCLGTAYVTANQVPNLIYELALGGALTSAMVPVLARSAERAGADPEQRARVAQITSALLTWTVVILLPLTAVIALAANPIAELLIPVNPNASCARADMVDVTRNMIAVFAPQIVLYGLSVVLFGLLQAYRRFTGPTLAPVIANFVLIGSFLLFASLDQGQSLASTPLAAELVLSVGTTMNIGILVIVALPPTWRLHLRLRPRLRFPAGVMRQAGGLALVGVLEFLASDAAAVVLISLVNGHGDTGALVIFNYAWMVYLAVYSVLAMAIVTSAFPVLAATDGDVFDRTCAGSARGVVLVSWLGTALIAAVSVAAAHVLAKQPEQVPQLIQGFAFFAPGVVAAALVTNASRIMFALGRLKVAAAGLVATQLLQILLSVPLVLLLPAHWVVGSLAAAFTVSQAMVAVPMVIATRRIRGKAATHGVGHAMLAGLAAGGAGAAAGVAVSLAMPAGGKLAEGVAGAVAAACSVAVFAVVAYLLDRGDLRTAIARLRRFGKLRA